MKTIGNQSDHSVFTLMLGRDPKNKLRLLLFNWFIPNPSVFDCIPLSFIYSQISALGCWNNSQIYLNQIYVIVENSNSLFHAFEAIWFEKPFMALKVWHWHFPFKLNVFSGYFTKWFTNELTQFPHHCLQWVVYH